VTERKQGKSDAWAATEYKCGNFSPVGQGGKAPKDKRAFLEPRDED
jgi:hypothetical protein